MHKYILRVFLLTILTVSAANLAFTQINTEAMRRSDLKKQFTTTGSINYQINKGNSDYAMYKAKVRFDYLKDKNHVFLISNFKQGEQKSMKFVNKGFLHLRGVRFLNNYLSVEGFSQIEFDDFIKLKRRKLLGGSLRILTINEKDLLTLHSGIGLMNEQENYTDPAEGKRNLIRSTNYLSGKLMINNYVDLFLVGYYQVDVKSVSDFRILIDSGLKVKLIKAISFIVDLDYRFDNEPLAGVKEYDLTISNGIIFNF